MDRPIGSTENARTAREVVLVDPATGAPRAPGLVQGDVASGVADSGLPPVKVGGVYNQPQLNLLSGQRGDVQLNLKGEQLIAVDQLTAVDSVPATPCAVHDRAGTSRPLAGAAYLFNPVSALLDRQRGDAAGGAWIQGPAADNAPAAGNPVWVGAKYFSGTQAYSDGDVASLQANVNGILMVGAPSSAGSDTMSNSLAFLNDKSGGTRPLAVASWVFNGTTWDRKRKPNLVARLLSSAASTNATLVKSSPGDVWRIIGRNASASPIFLKLYNKATSPVVGTDAPVMTLRVGEGSNFDFDLQGQYFQAGIGFALTGGASDSDTTAIAAGDVVAFNLTYA